MTKRQVILTQEELLRGIHLSDTDDIQFSRGRDGYNKSLDADIVEDDLDISSFLDEADISTLPLDRFLGSRGPWTPMDFDLSHVENSRRYVLDKQERLNDKSGEPCKIAGTIPLRLPKCPNNLQSFPLTLL